MKKWFYWPWNASLPPGASRSMSSNRVQIEDDGWWMVRMLGIFFSIAMFLSNWTTCVAWKLSRPLRCPNIFPIKANKEVLLLHDYWRKRGKGRKQYLVGSSAMRYLGLPSNWSATDSLLRSPPLIPRSFTSPTRLFATPIKFKEPNRPRRSVPSASSISSLTNFNLRANFNVSFTIWIWGYFNFRYRRHLWIKEKVRRVKVLYVPHTSEHSEEGIFLMNESNRTLGIFHTSYRVIPMPYVTNNASHMTNTLETGVSYVSHNHTCA